MSVIIANSIFKNSRNDYAIVIANRVRSMIELNRTITVQVAYFSPIMEELLWRTLQ